MTIYYLVTSRTYCEPYLFCKHKSFGDFVLFKFTILIEFNDKDRIYKKNTEFSNTILAFIKFRPEVKGYTSSGLLNTTLLSFFFNNINDHILLQNIV